jgi:serine/threonine protein kinase
MSHKPYSYSADVYSFAVILWELLTKDIPWRVLHIDGRLPPMSMFQEVKEKKKRLAVPEGTPWIIRELIAQCWHPEADNRPKFGAILEQLERASISMSASNREFLNKTHIAASDLVVFQAPDSPPMIALRDGVPHEC